MSSANVLPSAPPEQIYPELPLQPQPDFRVQKVNESSASLNKEVGHYRAVAKNINVPRKQSTGALLAPVVFLRHFQARVLAPLFLLLVCRLQSCLVTSVGLLLSLLQGS